jgi:hypothetical protein
LHDGRGPITAPQRHTRERGAPRDECSMSRIAALAVRPLRVFLAGERNSAQDGGRVRRWSAASHAKRHSTSPPGSRRSFLGADGSGKRAGRSPASHLLGEERGRRPASQRCCMRPWRDGPAFAAVRATELSHGYAMAFSPWPGWRTASRLRTRRASPVIRTAVPSPVGDRGSRTRRAPQR